VNTAFRAAALEDALPPELARVCAPIHKRILGVAVGLTAGALMFVMTAFHILANPTSGPNIQLLNQYFYGYTVSWTGAVVGALWGGFGGFVAGWFLAFVRNVCVAVRIWYVSARAELMTTHDLLDHI
jgi:hypothetical protein